MNDDTYLLWENDRSFPSVKMMPRVIKFVGFYPFKEPTTLAEQLLRRRRYEGLTQEEMARRLGLDEGTVRQVECDTRSLSPNTIEKVRQSLSERWQIKDDAKEVASGLSLQPHLQQRTMVN